MASNEEVDDDDFYSAANWADVADPDVLGFDEPVSTPQQAQETARVPSPRAQRRRSRRRCRTRCRSTGYVLFGG